MIMIEISDFNISFFSCKDAARFLQSYLVLSQPQFYLFVLLSWAHGKGATCINGMRIESTLLLFKHSHVYLQQLEGGV